MRTCKELFQVGDVVYHQGVGLARIVEIDYAKDYVRTACVTGGTFRGRIGGLHRDITGWLENEKEMTYRRIRYGRVRFANN